MHMPWPSSDVERSCSIEEAPGYRPIGAGAGQSYPCESLDRPKHGNVAPCADGSGLPRLSTDHSLMKLSGLRPSGVQETERHDPAYAQLSPSERSILEPEFPSFLDRLDSTESLLDSSQPRRRGPDKPHQSQRRANRDEFDGPVQYLDKPPLDKLAAQERDLPHVPINLEVSEQDQVLRQVNDYLSQCAFDFIAKYQFPIPFEPDKRPVQKPSDREWTEWAFLIKRLATKRRIPARVLYNGQIKQLVTVLENSLEMRHASAHSSRPPKDDRNILQLISAGTQVAKMLKDANTMEYLDKLYRKVDEVIQERRERSPWGNTGYFTEGKVGSRKPLE